MREPSAVQRGLSSRGRIATVQELQAQPAPQEPGTGEPHAVRGEASALPVAAKTEMSFTTSLCPAGHSTCDVASARGRRSSNEVSQVLQRYSYRGIGSSSGRAVPVDANRGFWRRLTHGRASCHAGEVALVAVGALVDSPLTGRCPTPEAPRPRRTPEDSISGSADAR